MEKFLLFATKNTLLHPFVAMGKTPLKFPKMRYKNVAVAAQSVVFWNLGHIYASLMQQQSSNQNTPPFRKYENAKKVVTNFVCYRINVNFVHIVVIKLQKIILLLHNSWIRGNIPLE